MTGVVTNFVANTLARADQINAAFLQAFPAASVSAFSETLTLKTTASQWRVALGVVAAPVAANDNEVALFDGGSGAVKSSGALWSSVARININQTWTGTQDLTGAIVTVPNQSSLSYDQSAANTKFVGDFFQSVFPTVIAPIASPAFTGNPTAPTPSAGDNDTSIATTAFVQTAINNRVPATNTQYGLVYGNGTSALAVTAAMTNGQVLVGQTSAAPLPKTVSGDATMAASGALTVTKVNGAPVGTAAGNIVALDGSARLPAVDGSQLTNVNAGSVSVRQTVLSGPASNGLPSFLPATSGSLSLTSQNISTGVNSFVATAANGFGASGSANVIGVATSNLTWSGLAASSTAYLGVTISGGTLTPFSTTLQPIYQRGGTISVANGQYTFDIVGMQMYLGNGSVANPVNAVFVGEAVTSGSAVTSTVAYAYQGQWIYIDTGNLPGSATTVVKNHNIGVDGNVLAKVRVVCLTAQYGYSVGDVVDDPVTWTNSAAVHFAPITRRNTVQFTTGSTYSGWHLIDQTAGTISTSGITPANWRYQLVVQRGW